MADFINNGPRTMLRTGRLRFPRGQVVTVEGEVAEDLRNLILGRPSWAGLEELVEETEEDSDSDSDSDSDETPALADFHWSAIKKAAAALGWEGGDVASAREYLEAADKEAVREALAAA